MEYIYIQYRLQLQDGRDLAFKLRLDPHTSEAVEATPPAPPAWTALGYHQCPNCPLDAATHPHCPAALRLSEVVGKCNKLDAYAPARIEVTTPERAIVAAKPLQKGLGSLMGLMIATSGCPRAAYLRPMARFHLPFATDDEAIYRAASMYLLAQYFRRKDGRDPDLDLEGLSEIYRNLQIVNTALTKRLETATGKGATTSAIATLDLFSHTLPYNIKNSLDSIRRYFDSYFSVL